MGRDSITNKVLLQGSKYGVLYNLDFSVLHDSLLSRNMHFNVCAQNLGISEISTTHMSCSLGQVKVHSIVLHQRLGHSSSHNNMSVYATVSPYVACTIGKNCNLPFSESYSVNTYFLDLLEIDLRVLLLCHLITNILSYLG